MGRRGARSRPGNRSGLACGVGSWRPCNASGYLPDLLGHYGDDLRLHKLRHSSATHLGDANTSANVIMAKTGHKSLRSVQRYVKPGLAAVHQATETLSSPRRRG